MAAGECVLRALSVAVGAATGACGITFWVPSASDDFRAPSELAWQTFVSGLHAFDRRGGLLTPR